MSFINVAVKKAGYKNNDFYIKNIYFSLKKSDLLLITGPSGSGKTTLVKAMLAILDKVLGGYFIGKRTLNGVDPYTLDSKELYKMVAYVPQDPWYAILAHTVLAEYCSALIAAGYRCEDKLQALLKEFKNKIYDPVYTLSAGLIQKLVLLPVLERETNIIVLDEPTVYIDKSYQEKTIDYIKKAIYRGSTVIVIDHDIEKWRDLDPMILILKEGFQKYFGVYRDDLLDIPLYNKQSFVSNDIILVARNVWFKYPGTRKYVIKNFDMELYRGEKILLYGPNGSGKTTLLKILAGIYKPKRGYIDTVASRIYVPENPLLYFTEPTIYDEVVASSIYSQDYALKIIDKLGLNRIINKPLALTSVGERRRVAVLSALLRGYDILLLDEPTGGLDPWSLNNLLELLDNIVAKDKTIVLASHDKRVLGFVDRVVCVKEGVIEECQL
ncbi:MAG: ATP-binding cassette domain-containing protein [Desulfurococcales archaeon]|nr:ATP-binding cassette domain-containing protein [Desulfurococcales archaeon]